MSWLRKLVWQQGLNWNFYARERWQLGQYVLFSKYKMGSGYSSPAIQYIGYLISAVYIHSWNSETLFFFFVPSAIVNIHARYLPVFWPHLTILMRPELPSSGSIIAEWSTIEPCLFSAIWKRANCANIWPTHRVSFYGILVQRESLRKTSFENLQAWAPRMR